MDSRSALYSPVKKHNSCVKPVLKAHTTLGWMLGRERQCKLEVVIYEMDEELGLQDIFMKINSRREFSSRNDRSIIFNFKLLSEIEYDQVNNRVRKMINPSAIELIWLNPGFFKNSRLLFQYLKKKNLSQKKISEQFEPPSYRASTTKNSVVRGSSATNRRA